MTPISVSLISYNSNQSIQIGNIIYNNQLYIYERYILEIARIAERHAHIGKDESERVREREIMI